MAAAKRTAKSKLIIEEVSEVVNRSQDLKDSPKTMGKKSHRRQRSDQSEEEEMSQLIGPKKKMKKVESNVENTTEFGQQILNLVNHQIEARKECCSEKLFKRLAEASARADTAFKQFKLNEQKLGLLTKTNVKCIQQTTAAYKQNLEPLKETASAPASFKNECAMESEQNAEIIKLMDELQITLEKNQD